ncbi:hypothetical protein AX17_002470 [Amanita inopinata Kibby_2008]|nr:hypothetical protein AX17_002470 [Amanita inopinata Kibby_2008]
MGKRNTADSNKSADKKANDKKNKVKDGDGEESKSKGKGLKAATAINVRHVLCEKHSKATEALQKIQVSNKFQFVPNPSSLRLAQNCQTGRSIVQQGCTRIFRRQSQSWRKPWLDDTWKHGGRVPGCRVRTHTFHRGQTDSIILGENQLWLPHYHGRGQTLNVHSHHHHHHHHGLPCSTSH